jgi:hypothetical protein
MCDGVHMYFQEDLQFQAHLGYTERPCPKNKQTKPEMSHSVLLICAIIACQLFSKTPLF